MDDKKKDFTREERSQQRMYKLGYWLGQKAAERGAKKNTSTPQQPKKPARPVTRSKTEYVFFGSFPQTIKPRDVRIDYSIEDNEYVGSDGNRYCKKDFYGRDKGYAAGKFTYAAGNHPEGSVRRYSDGQDIQDDEYFLIEPIKWYVVHRENGILTLLSENIIFYSVYNKIKDSIFNMAKSGKPWQSSIIRKLLNNEFYSTAFSAQEQSKILQSCVTTDSGESSIDKVYLLSKSECSKYGLNSVDLSKHQTDFCGQYIEYISGSPSRYYSAWMTRTVSGSSPSSETDPYRYTFTYVADGWGDIVTLANESYLANRGVVPVIRVKESDLIGDDKDDYQSIDNECVSELESELESESKNESENELNLELDNFDSPKQEYASNYSNSGNYTPKNNASNDDPNSYQTDTTSIIPKKKRLKYTILAIVFWFFGPIAEIFAGGDGMRSFGGLLWIGYLVFCEIMVWKIESKRWLIKLLVGLTAVVSIISWLLF